MVLGYNLISILQNKMRDTFRIRTLPDHKLIKKYMSSVIIIVADVGATGNPKGIWKEAGDFCHFVLFDPDPRAIITQSSSRNVTVYPLGLWSSNTKKELFLTAFPEASTFFQYNTSFIDKFLNAESHKVIDTESMHLKKLDSVVKKDNLFPDFIKVDTEGADLEVLKGARQRLHDKCLGVFIKVSFAERYQKGPLFAEIDNFLRMNKFMLMDIFLERWIRKSNLSSPFTRHQVIWGNALYILSAEEFIRRLKKANKKSREELFVKYIIILLLYQLHDYAEEIISTSVKKKLILKKDAEIARNLLKKSIKLKRSNTIRLLSSIVFALIGMIIFLPAKRLWRENKLFLQIQFGELCCLLINYSTHRYKGHVVDPIDPSSRI
jgi:FkbM family methyltransferase